MSFKKNKQYNSHFWDRWRKEYVSHLREQQKIKYENYNYPTTKDIVLIEEDKKPRSAWKIGIIGEPIQGKDDKVGGAIVRIPKYNFFSNMACKQAVSDRMYE